ncbi:MAG: peptide deformylase [Planctomycetota bacterium]
MTLEVIRYPHPTLRYTSKNIMKVDAELRGLAGEMLELMYEKNGVGLAANQVDLPLRMFVANPTGEKGSGEEYILLNPEIQLPKGSEVGDEGCLSLPGLTGKVARPKSIRISAYDIKGNQFETRVDGFLARVFLHEIDHLNGVMFFDRMEEAEVEEIADGIDEMTSEFRKQQESGEIPADDELVARLKVWTDKYC